MTNKILDKIRSCGLIEQGDRILVGLSGGADSMCLTHALSRLKSECGIEIFTAHMNHNIRGDAALRDERAAADFAVTLGIEHFSRSADVRGLARREKISEELAGRRLRYEFFSELKEKYGFNKIATAHNKNDNAETILMNFMRGSAVNGLGGIPASRGDIIRPLLGAAREEIEEYCMQNGLPYVTDATNSEPIYTRNKVRLALIPAIVEGFNPNFIDTVTRNASLIREDCGFIDAEADKIYKKRVKDGRINIDELMELHPSVRRRVVMRMIADAAGGLSDISSDCAERVFALCESGKTGKQADISGEAAAAVEYGELVIGKRVSDTSEFEYELKKNKEVIIKEAELSAYLGEGEPPEGADALVFSGNAERVCIRNRRNGDYFYPAGMSGKKKLKKFFIDEKIPAQERMKTGIITVNGEIACVIGKRRDRRSTENAVGGKRFYIILKNL